MVFGIFLTPMTIFGHVIKIDLQLPWTRNLTTQKQANFYIIWKVLTSWSTFNKKLGVKSRQERRYYEILSPTSVPDTSTYKIYCGYIACLYGRLKKLVKSIDWNIFLSIYSTIGSRYVSHLIKIYCLIWLLC